MLKQDLGSPSPADLDAGIVPLEDARREPAAQDAGESPADAGAFAQTTNDEVAREVADIEAATAALRKAEPALESWNKSPEAAARKPRPLWLIVGVLWLSTALVTAGAVVAIATLAG
jgi:hypothetical protein